MNKGRERSSATAESPVTLSNERQAADKSKTRCPRMSLCARLGGSPGSAPDEAKRRMEVLASCSDGFSLRRCLSKSVGGC